MPTATDFEIKAIPTVYNGIQLRSRMEAQCATLFDALGWEWQYEPFSVMVDGTSYTPDFYFPKLRAVIECRGYETEHGDDQILKFGRAVQSGIEIPGFKVARFLCIGPERTVGYRDEYSNTYSNAGIRVCRYCQRWFIQIPHVDVECFCGADQSQYSAVLYFRIERGKIMVGQLPKWSISSQDFNRLKIGGEHG